MVSSRDYERAELSRCFPKMVFDVVYIHDMHMQWRRQDFFGGGGRTLFENCLKKISSENWENALFKNIFKKFNKPCVSFFGVWKKNANS